MRQGHAKKGISIFYFLKPFPRFLTPLQQTAFSKQSDKRRNCSKWAISSFATMFSSFWLIGYPFNYRDFLFFDKICLKSSAAELLYEGKGVKKSLPLFDISAEVRLLKSLWRNSRKSQWLKVYWLSTVYNIKVN